MNAAVILIAAWLVVLVALCPPIVLVFLPFLVLWAMVAMPYAVVRHGDAKDDVRGDFGRRGDADTGNGAE